MNIKLIREDAEVETTGLIHKTTLLDGFNSTWSEIEGKKRFKILEMTNPNRVGIYNKSVLCMSDGMSCTGVAIYKFSTTENNFIQLICCSGTQIQGNSTVTVSCNVQGNTKTVFSVVPTGKVYIANWTLKRTYYEDFTFGKLYDNEGVEICDVLEEKRVSPENYYDGCDCAVNEGFYYLARYSSEKFPLAIKLWANYECTEEPLPRTSILIHDGIGLGNTTGCLIVGYKDNIEGKNKIKEGKEVLRVLRNKVPDNKDGKGYFILKIEERRES